MSEPVDCRRCGRKHQGLSHAPHPGELGRQIQLHVCVDCWNEWREMEVRVINELRLNFIDPESQEVLAKHLAEFLHLQPTAESGEEE